MKYVTASLHDKIFYLPQDSVLYVEHKAVVTGVPLSPGWIVGVMPYRDEPIPVVDAFARGVPAASLQILCSLDESAVAYQADSIGNLCEMEEAETQPLIIEGGRFRTHIRIPKTEM